MIRTPSQFAHDLKAKRVCPLCRRTAENVLAMLEEGWRDGIGVGSLSRWMREEAGMEVTQSQVQHHFDHCRRGQTVVRGAL